MPDCTMCLDCFGHDNDTEYTAGFRAGAASERERILKLLEPYVGCRDELCYPYCSCRRSEFAIALIKEENK
jgi:hypothetical protein